MCHKLHCLLSRLQNIIYITTDNDLSEDKDKSMYMY